MNLPRLLGRIALAIGALSSISWCAPKVAADDDVCCVAEEPVCCGQQPVYYTVQETVADAPHQPSWIFQPSTYTHDPTTGARVAQYERKPPVEPLDDERAVTSRYRRTRTILRGADGSSDTYYQVQAWGNGRGGIDAEWERFHDAWKESILSGGYYNATGAGPYGYGGQGYGYGNPGYGNPGWGYGGPLPGNGWNGPPNGGWNGGPNWQPNGNGWNGNNGPHGGWNNGHGQHDGHDNDNDHGHDD